MEKVSEGKTISANKKVRDRPRSSCYKRATALAEITKVKSSRPLEIRVNATISKIKLAQMETISANKVNVAQ